MNKIRLKNPSREQHQCPDLHFGLLASLKRMAQRDLKQLRRPCFIRPITALPDCLMVPVFLSGMSNTMNTPFPSSGTMAASPIWKAESTTILP
ncbi:MAG: hypothetical protein IPK83_04410 [Planctomycetes bacterium]|nr:hypothetical protein [Planctomycetota bacterium]